jgi:hypothetical protein
VSPCPARNVHGPRCRSWVAPYLTDECSFLSHDL